jgi:transcription initiation factor TFIID TATA-box-binding protein
MTDRDAEVVSITALGNIHQEVDIQTVAEDVSLPTARYDADLNASLFRFEEDGELILLYTSGKYILRGGDEFDWMYKINDKFLDVLSGLGIDVAEASLEVKNIVTLGKLEQKLNLNALMIELGIEFVEYEPEQFPGLVFRPPGTGCVLLIFSSGKVVITGGQTKQENEEAFSSLIERIEKS